ncbi:hypothetical protein [Flagellimonas nanhaiensis]|uniref:DNA circulation N-terminal domain-containing protein n=1 Tax=Flagellimonas nanhaiensis TaxID=2292706 RepID=A0A371JLC1_9FLAO|nr:hypothetical protein [Allomuricauda nanhaiensis]RDY57719.1 hypothetical protein DX873_17630 [Allomuricauda nanhaiensis]
MSWEDRLENIKFTIVTGDGKKFTPLWISGDTSLEFNAKKYNFINVEKSYIDRKKPRSTKIPLIFYFQGEDNIDQSSDFLKSAKDSRVWEVTHPFYGTIIGQPTSISRVDGSYNSTRFAVDFWETLTEDYPNSQISTKDVIQKKVDEVNIFGIANYTKGAQPTSADISTIKQNSNDVASKFDRLHTPDTFTEYKNKLSQATKSVDNIISRPSEVIENNQSLLLLPGTYQLPVSKRINAIYLAYLQVRSIVTGKNDKYYFESLAATAIAAISNAAVNPLDEDYITRDHVNASTSLLLNTYNDYIETIDKAQVSRYDVENEWAPNPQLQQSLNNLVIDTVANLYQLAFGAKQERIVEVEADTNLIVLTHRYMGLDEGDKNMETFRTINNIKNDEVFRIKKGRKIKYFVG